MGNTEGYECGYDAGNSVAHESPRDSLSRFDSGVKHCHDGHNAGSNAAFGSAKENAESDCRLMLLARDSTITTNSRHQE